MIIPSFTYKQVKDYCKNPTVEKVFADNVAAGLSAFQDSYPDKDMIFICRKERIDDNDVRFSVSCFDVKNKTTYIKFDGFDKAKDMVIVFGEDIVITIKRILKNLSFS